MGKDPTDDPGPFVTTTETFPASVAQVDLEREVQLRLNAGALEASYTRQGSEWVLTTKWRILGANT
jgi:hypothetical protein